MKTIESLKDLLSNKNLRMEIIKNELIEVKENTETKEEVRLNYAGGEFNY